jgi:hypothetical protein
MVGPLSEDRISGSGFFIGGEGQKTNDRFKDQIGLN